MGFIYTYIVLMVFTNTDIGLMGFTNTNTNAYTDMAYLYNANMTFATDIHYQYW